MTAGGKDGEYPQPHSVPESGFTLIEMAIVIAIIGLLLGGLLIPLGTQLENRRIRDAEKQLAEIEAALFGFAITALNPRLPCPDIDGDGLEDPAAPEALIPCLQLEGGLPWASLGLVREDPWGRPFRYAPDQAFAQAQGIPSIPNTTSGFKVQDHTETPLTDWTPASPPGPPPNGPTAILFSYGNDNNGTINAHADCTNPGISDGLYTADVRKEGTFDDILIWLSRNTLLNRLVAAGVWP